MKFDTFYFLLGWLGIFVCFCEVKPALAATKQGSNVGTNSQQFDNRKAESSSVSAQDLLAPEDAPASPIRVTGIELTQTDNGLEIVFQTPTKEQLSPSILPEGNNLIINILDATLALQSGNEFRAIDPIPGILEIRAVQVDNSNIRVTITGAKQAPIAEVMPSQENLVLNINPEARTAQTQVDEEIEIIVTGEQVGSDYFVPDATTATRTDTPILDTPQSVQIIPQQILEDQQVIRLDQALRNVSGVTFGGTSLGRRLEFNVRGFDEAPILRNGFRQFGADVIPETANLERIEILKGPASVLYGESEPGGLINLVTKKPTSVPFYEIQAQFGNRSFISPSIDFSGPLTADGNLLYRLNALYRSHDDIQDVDSNIERFYVAPVVTWRMSDRTNLSFELEYLNEKRPPTFGVPAIGDAIADIPFDRITNEPDDFGEEEYISAGYDFEHRFNDNLRLRNAFRFTTQNALLEVAFPFEINEETGIVTRFWAAQPQEAKSYSLQTSAIGEFVTGAVDHELLLGVDLNITEDNFNDRIRLDDANPLELNLFDPVYETVPRPDFNQLPLIIDRETETRRLGVFIQDRISFADNFFLLAGLRYDTVEQTVTNNPTDFEPTSTQTIQNNDALIPRIGVVYKPIAEISLYASYAQSFTPNPETTSDGTALEPERGQGFELGVKSELLEGKLFATLAYFNITKQNVASNDPNDPFSFVATGEQASQGIELDVSGEILPGWNVIASYAYIDAEVTEDNVLEVGNRLPNTPEHSVNLWTTYEIQQGDLQGLGFGVGFNFVGNRLGDLENSFELDSYFLANAAVFYKRNNWRAALNFRNLFDSYCSALLKDLGFQIVFPPNSNGKEAQGGNVSLELLPQLTADSIFVQAYNRDFTNLGQDLVNDQIAVVKQQWNNNAIAQSLPATKSDRVYFISAYLCRAMPGPIGAEIFLNQIQQELSAKK